MGEATMYQGIRIDDPSDLEDLKLEHLRTLSAPLDAYWEEALIGFADHYEMQIEGERSGFYCINSDTQLVAFYLSDKCASHASAAVSYIVDKHRVPAALAGTNDAFFLSLCLDVAASSRVHSLLFQDNQPGSVDLPGFDQISFDLASESDFEDVFSHYCAASGSLDVESVETGYEDLRGYIRSVMDQHHIFLLRQEGKLIATSECRISKTQQPYADVGMIVAEESRCKGFGSYILARTKRFCYERDVVPICSCEADNLGSQKAIIKAGFVSRHRIVLTEFGP